MADRREFMKYAMVSAVPLATRVSLAATAPPCAIRHVVVDTRHEEGLSFGASLADTGATVHALADGDVTDLWLGTLSPAWRDAPVPVAGLTHPPALFILEQLAWSHGLRVVYHAEHVVRTAAPTRHHILRAPPAGLTAAGLERFDSLWPDRLAGMAAQFAPAAISVSRPGPTPAGLLPELPAGAALLTSWIIAPA